MSYLDRSKEKAAVKPPLSSIDCNGARVALQHCPISRNNGDYYSISDTFWKQKRVPITGVSDRVFLAKQDSIKEAAQWATNILTLMNGKAS